ncbi:MAG: haloacid dehalogenase type II [Rhodospirillales bacterium]
MSINTVKAIVFDTFGTITDWRSSIAREAGMVANAKGLQDFDGDAFARAWRAGYRPGMMPVITGERAWTPIDVIHRERLEEILPEFGLDMLDDGERDHLNRAWHRINPWPDSIPGLLRLKKKFFIAPLSNGSLALLAGMAKRAGIPWDFVFSSDMHKAYKRDPKVYQNAIALLGFEPGEVMMGAAHNDDLEAAREQGMRTAYINRPSEYGVDQSKDFEATSDWDIITDSAEGVADAMGC